MEIFNNPKSGGLQFKGTWEFEIFEGQPLPDESNKVLTHKQDNIIVDNAIVHMASGVGPAKFSSLHLGNAAFPSTPDVSQTDLDLPLFSGDTTHVPANSPGTFSFQKKLTLQEADAVGTLTEAGLFTTDGVMLNRVLISPPIVKTNTQTAFVKVTIQLRRV